MKKQELRHDAFRENLVKCVQYLNDKQATVIKIFIIMILIVGGMSYYNHLGASKRQSAAHLTGRAQNIFINGNLDEALVKFERVLDDYPNTPSAVLSLVYLLKGAVSNNDLDKVSELLTKNYEIIEDPFLLGAFYKLRGDVDLAEGDHSTALKYYKKAASLMNESSLQIKYQLDIVSILLAKENYDEALKNLEKILINKDIVFNDKNQVEELIAYTKQKMGI